jgi:hypothetical protein
VEAPAAVIVVEDPTQIAAGAADAVTVGNALTVIKEVLISASDPEALVAVSFTVYVPAAL